MITPRCLEMENYTLKFYCISSAGVRYSLTKGSVMSGRYILWPCTSVWLTVHVIPSPRCFRDLGFGNLGNVRAERFPTFESIDCPPWPLRRPSLLRRRRSVSLPLMSYISDITDALNSGQLVRRQASSTVLLPRMDSSCTFDNPSDALATTTTHLFPLHLPYEALMVGLLGGQLLTSEN